MNILFKTFLIFLTLFISVEESFALSDKKIREICQKQRRRLTCIKTLKLKKSNLLEGKRIEIPVIYYKK